jgi:hypothetical protein
MTRSGSWRQAESYSVAGARAVLMLFALMSLGQLMLAVFALVALIRYRAGWPLPHAGRSHRRGRGFARSRTVAHEVAIGCALLTNRLVAVCALLPGYARRCSSLRHERVAREEGCKGLRDAVPAGCALKLHKMRRAK